MGERVGSTLGAVGGLVFVWFNAESLPLPWSPMLRGIGAFLFLAALILVFRSRPPTGPPPSRSALRAYGVCVVAEVVLIIVGSRILDYAGLGRLGVIWVVAMVGVHFLPFARAFGQPLFLRLGLGLIGLAVLGLLTALMVGPPAPALTGVAAGFLLLGVVARSALARRS